MKRMHLSNSFIQSVFILALIIFSSCADSGQDTSVDSGNISDYQQVELESKDNSSSERSPVWVNSESEQLQNASDQKYIEVIPSKIVKLSEESVPDQEGEIDLVPQPPPQGKEEDEIYDFPSESPIFPGGEAGMVAFIQNNMIYPEVEKYLGVVGVVYLRFVVEKDGSVSNVIVLRGVKEGAGLDKEAIRIVKSFPKFTPGKNDGKIVRTCMTIPVRFKLS